MKKTCLVFLCLAFQLFSANPKLCVYDDASIALLQQTSDVGEIADVLRTIGVRFEQWEAAFPLSYDAKPEEVLEAYKSDVEKLQRENGYQSVDVLKMVPDHPKKVELRNKFLNEHTHTEDEVRFFVEGSGLFYLHVGGKVYSVLCERGDLISIPAYYSHWFDMSKDPSFTAIRFFIRTDGWIAHFTGSELSKRFIPEEDRY